MNNQQNQPINVGNIDRSIGVIAGNNNTQNIYVGTSPHTIDSTRLEDAHTLLGQMPLDDIPPVQSMPTPSRIAYRSNPHFVGRTEELRTLAAHLKGGGSTAIGQIAATTGLGGIGKTQLAAAFAHRYGHYFAGGVYWLNMADPASVNAEVALCGQQMAALDPAWMSRPTGMDFASQELNVQVQYTLSAWQSPLPHLLIFDNCEEPEVLNRWHPPTGGCRVLVTSRRHEWDAAFGVQTVALKTLPRAESIALLLKFRPDLAGGFDGSNPYEPGGPLDAIADALGDLPLAIHMAGSYLRRYKHMPLVDYLRELTTVPLDHPSMQTGEYTPTEHDLHIARTFAVSSDKLDPTDEVDAVARAVLARVACFAPGEPIPRDLLAGTIDATASYVEDAEPLTGPGIFSTLASFFSRKQKLPTGSPPELPDAPPERLLDDAIQRLLELGLVEQNAEGALTIHRLVLHFVQMLALDDVAQNEVEQFVDNEAARINNAGIPGPLLVWQPHLRYVTDYAKERQDERAARLCNNLGYHLKMTGDYEAARPYYEQALAIRLEVLGDNHPHTARSLNNLGTLLDSMGDFEAAHLYYEQALAIRLEVLGDNHPDTALSLNNLGGILQLLKEHGKAQSHYERALSIWQEVFGEKHPDTATSLTTLGFLFYETKRYEQALPYFEKAVDIFCAIFGENHPSTATSFNNLGAVLEAMGDYEAGLKYYKKALSIWKEVLGDNHPNTATGLNNIGVFLYEREQYNEALPYLQEALTIKQGVLGAEHPSTQRTQEWLCKVQNEMR
ncbi:MAG: tetratricopeptide repeat protein [Chloroflexota bacterium]